MVLIAQAQQILMLFLTKLDAMALLQMFMGSKTQENVMLKTRKGFVRVAVEEGLDGGIVPVYHFGNSQASSVPSNDAPTQRVNQMLNILPFRVPSHD